MDTLADLASMQYHQPQRARADSGRGGLYSALQTQTLPQGSVTSSMELTMPDAPLQTPPLKTYVSPSVSEDDLQMISRLVGELAENPVDLNRHTQLVKLLHKGLRSHIKSSSSLPGRDPHEYELLEDLQHARDAMHQRFAMGEDLWMDWLEDQKSLARTIDEVIGVIESCKKAVVEESGSVKLWSLYGEYMLLLYESSHDLETMSGENTNVVQEWSEEDKAVAREVFTWQQMIEVWEQAVTDVQWHIAKSHLIWDRYMELSLRELSILSSPQAIDAIETKFTNRLRIPHATWDQTFQLYSTFVTRYDNAHYEGIMSSTSQAGGQVKKFYELRDVFETKLQRVSEANNMNLESEIHTDYINWELSQPRKKKGFSSEIRFDIINALFQRTTLRFPSNASLWEDYVMFIGEETSALQRRSVSSLSVLARASLHCPWSGSLWSLYLVVAERQSLSTEEIGQIKHKATSSGLLDAGGMEEILKVHTAYCGYLRRKAFLPDSTDEDLDVAEVGIRSAIEDMETLGRQKYGAEYQGDPQARLERIYIKYWSQSHNWQAGRDTFENLLPRRGNSYEFWLRYYVWEMYVWGKLAEHKNNTVETNFPRKATEVLRRATMSTNLDWPETILDKYLSHCEDHEDVDQIQSANVHVSGAKKALAKRREAEAQESYVGTQKSQDQQQEVARTETVTGSAKRKREDDIPDAEQLLSKKSRPDTDTGLQAHPEDVKPEETPKAKRDREHATIVVKNLPPTTTEPKLRQYFRDCGTINSLKLLPEQDGESCTATIEFESKEDVLAAQTKDMKTFDGKSIDVQISTGTTLFVTNFPPTADEAYIREKFDPFGEIVDVRFPSLKGNTHRRFCYLQFKHSSQAHNALQLNGQAVDEKRKLVVKTSDPDLKQQRVGSIYEGREVYISNLDWSATEQDISEVLSKHGTVERVRIPKSLAGKSIGTAFVTFATKEQAEASLELCDTQLKRRLIHVEISSPNPSKRQASTTVRASVEPSTRDGRSPSIQHSIHSPGPESLAEGNSAPTSRRPSIADIQARTIALLNVPDTVNDSRIRAIAEPYGALVKVVLRPDHQGAIIEYKDVASAGKATLGLTGLEIIPGRHLRVGTVKEMLQQPAEKKDRSGGNPKIALQSSVPIRRPTQPGTRGRGGLGFKKTPRVAKDADAEDATKQEGQAKSNADFKALFVKGKGDDV